MKKIKHEAALIVLLTLFAIYFIVLLKITIFRASNSETQNVNLSPFITITEYLKSILKGNRIIGISNILGNIIIFLPFGYMTALLFPNMRNLTRILVLAVIFSLTIEVFQYVFACGRADIDDIILNTLGGAAGYCVYFLTSMLFKPGKYAIPISALMIAFTCLGLFTVNNGGYPFDLPAPGLLPVHAKTLNRDSSRSFTSKEQPTGICLEEYPDKINNSN